MIPATTCVPLSHRTYEPWFACLKTALANSNYRMLLLELPVQLSLGHLNDVTAMLNVLPLADPASKRLLEVWQCP